METVIEKIKLKQKNVGHFSLFFKGMLEEIWKGEQNAFSLLYIICFSDINIPQKILSH